MQLRVELGHDRVGTHRVEEVGRGEPVDGLVVDEALDVDLRVVVVGERRVRLLEVGEALTERLDLVVERVVAGQPRSRRA